MTADHAGPVAQDGVVSATCDFGAQPGHRMVDCLCGIRYIPDGDDFLEFLDRIKPTVEATEAWRWPPGDVLLAARGRAEGEIDYDITRWGDGRRLNPDWRRCERFRITDLYRTT